MIACHQKLFNQSLKMNFKVALWLPKDSWLLPWCHPMPIACSTCHKWVIGPLSWKVCLWSLISLNLVYLSI